MKDNDGLSVFLTTHSPHIASVAPLRSLLLLKDTAKNGTFGRSTASINLANEEYDDLKRYLDVTRAELLFARGVLLVEGDAERFLIPALAENIGISLDALGITICSVSGTNFQPYAKLLSGLSIPFAIVTDWDPVGEIPLGKERGIQLALTIHERSTGKSSITLEAELRAIAKYSDLETRLDEFGVFTNVETLEIDLFQTDDFVAPICETLAEGPFGAKRKAKIDEWRKTPASIDKAAYLAMIEDIGKGRFAQRLATRVWKLEPPPYIASAIKFVAERV